MKINESKKQKEIINKVYTALEKQVEQGELDCDLEMFENLEIDFVIKMIFKNEANEIEQEFLLTLEEF